MRLAGVLGLGLARAGSVFNAIVATGSTLLDGLVSYWPLNEVSGTRADAVGDNDLTDNNTVGVSLAGPSGTVASFVDANDEFLSGANIVPAGALYTAGWVNLSAAANSGLWGVWQNGDFVWGFSGVGSAWAFNISSNGGSQENANGTLPLGGWHFVEGYFNPSTKLGIAIDGGAWSETVTAQAALRTPSGSNQFRIGNYYSDVYGFNGNVASVGIWSSIPDASVRTSLFNSGSGKAYSDLTTAEKVGLVSYWDLSETSGTRVDAHGSNDLSDNNTVGSVINSGGAMHNAAASFVAANSEVLSKANASGLVFGDADFSVSAWVNTAATDQTIVSHWDHGTIWNYQIQLSSGAPMFRLNSAAWPGNTATWGASVADSSWHLVIASYDAAASQLSISVDNGTPVTAAAAGAPAAEVGAFGVGADCYANGNYGASGLTGMVDEVAIWSRVLTADERTELWNAGRGVYYNGSDFA